MSSYLLALDQGTTSSRAILFDTAGQPVANHNEPVAQHFPQPGWVEHDPEDLWQSQLSAAQTVIRASGVSPHDIAAIGIANQRETTLIWDRRTGQPIANAIAWQCRRTASLCDRLRADGLEPEVRSRTGLTLDAYFSGTKIAWLLDQVPDARKRAERGELAFGTVDTWLIHRLTNGRYHLTDPSNASRTLLYNIVERRWDETLLKALRVPVELLPQVVPSSGVVAETSPEHFGLSIPIATVVGDQQAALFGHRCFAPGQAKNTYGTGCFLLMQTGEQPVFSADGLLTTIAWETDGQVEYALEGSVFVAGAVIQWLRDQLGLIAHAADSEALARSVRDNGGVYLVPAFVGLGAPHWDMAARGLMMGLTRGTTRAHIVRAALESIAYQTRDVVDAMSAGAGLKLDVLRVDGGATANDFLMQFQADLLGVPVERPGFTEATALGAAFLAGLAVGFWKDRDSLPPLEADRRFIPRRDAAAGNALYEGWQDAVRRCRQGNDAQ